MNTLTKIQTGEITIPWMIRRHFDDVLRIEGECFSMPWSEDDFIRCLRQRNAIGMVAKVRDDVAGYMIYELHRNRLHILNFAVAPVFMRRGVGTAMVAKLKGKLNHNRNRIMLEVRETNLDAQLFWKSQEFRAVMVVKDFYENAPGEDAYLFQYRHQCELATECTGR
jgi:ribosomal-protein-alanine N-acetyltransferase